MQRVIKILPTESRCRPFTTDCKQQATCARALAAKGTTDEPDLSVDARVYGAGVQPYCKHHLTLDRAAADATRRPVKTWPPGAPA